MKKQQQKPAKAPTKRQPANRQQALKTKSVPGSVKSADELKKEHSLFHDELIEKLRERKHQTIIDELSKYPVGDVDRIRIIGNEGVDILPILQTMNSWSVPLIEGFIDLMDCIGDSYEGPVSDIVNIFERLNAHAEEPLVKDRLLRYLYHSVNSEEEDNY